MIQLTLFDINKQVCIEWERAFVSFKHRVNIVNKDLVDLEPHDILVTAGNSFGIMAGGIDYYVNKLCKFKVESLVQQAIDSYWGQLPVGKFVTINIDKLTKGQFKVLVYAPTMKNPGERISPKDIFTVFYPIIKTYRATNVSIACPGLGSLTGGVPLNLVADEMQKAYIKGVQDEN